MPSRIARGIRSLLSASATPRTRIGVSRLLNPYECEMGTTPKFTSLGVIPIVSQMFSQSASNCSLRKRMARGAAVVPEVSLRREGCLSAQGGAVVAAEAPGPVGAAVRPRRQERSTRTLLPPRTAAAPTVSKVTGCLDCAPEDAVIDATAATRHVAKIALRCSSAIVCSRGNTTRRFRKQATNNDGQSG